MNSHSPTTVIQPREIQNQFLHNEEKSLERQKYIFFLRIVFPGRFHLTIKPRINYKSALSPGSRVAYHQLLKCKGAAIGL